MSVLECAWFATPEHAELQGGEGVEEKMKSDPNRMKSLTLGQLKKRAQAGANQTRIARRLKTGVELIWFQILPCASFYSVLRSTPEVSRMFQRNLEYTSIS